MGSSSSVPSSAEIMATPCTSYLLRNNIPCMYKQTLYTGMGSSSSVPIDAILPTVPTTVSTTTVRPVPILWGIEPSSQLGTPWVSTAASCQHAINVIFWISFIKCLFALITGLLIRIYKSTNGSYDYQSGKNESDDESIGTPWQWFFLSFMIIPFLAILAILLNSKETLKAFCVISIMILVTGFFNIMYLVRTCCDNGRVSEAVSVIFIVVGMILQIPSIVYAWPYTFSEVTPPCTSYLIVKNIPCMYKEILYT